MIVLLNMMLPEIPAQAELERGTPGSALKKRRVPHPNGAAFATLGWGSHRLSLHFIGPL